MNPDRMNPEYPYDQGDWLAQPQTYQYSRYGGAAFLDAWRATRRAVSDELGAPEPPPLPSAEPTTAAESEPIGRLSDHLEALLARLEADQCSNDAALWRQLDTWVRRFEVSKRLYEHYDAHGKTLDRRRYRELALYLRFAELMEGAWSRSARLPCLNVLLKTIDLLSACREGLTLPQRARLAGLIAREAEHVATLAHATGVPE